MSGDADAAGLVFAPMKRGEAVRAHAQERLEAAQTRRGPEADMLSNGKRRIVVGIDQWNYNGARNTYAPVAGVDYRKRMRVPVDRLSRPPWMTNVFAGWSRDADLLHLWNRVSLGRSAWGVSFEDRIPRDRAPAVVRRFFARRLAHPSCRFVLAISQFARRALLASCDADTREKLAAKLHILYPHQERQNGHVRHVAADEPLRVLFVGGDYFRKGGDVVLRAVEAVGEELDIDCTIVSRVGERDCRLHGPGDDALAEARRRLDRHPRARWYPRLEPDEVMREIAGAHVGLLPSVGDTFGYSILEMMSTGLPVIGSRLQAIPEIVGETGWLLDLDVDGLGEWPGWTHVRDARSLFAKAQSDLAHGLVRTLREIRERPETVRTRSEAALARARVHFDPDARARRLREIYLTATRCQR